MKWDFIVVNELLLKFVVFMKTYII